MNEKGKLTFSGILFTFIILYGIFAAIQLITAKLTEDEVKNVIKDRIGLIRGSSFTVKKGMDNITELLKDYARRGKIEFTDEYHVYVTTEKNGKVIKFTYEFDIVTNLIFTKKIKEVVVNLLGRNMSTGFKNS